MLQNRLLGWHPGLFQQPAPFVLTSVCLGHGSQWRFSCHWQTGRGQQIFGCWIRTQFVQSLEFSKLAQTCQVQNSHCSLRRKDQIVTVSSWKRPGCAGLPATTIFQYVELALNHMCCCHMQHTLLAADHPRQPRLANSSNSTVDIFSHRDPSCCFGSRQYATPLDWTCVPMLQESKTWHFEASFPVFGTQEPRRCQSVNLEETVTPTKKNMGRVQVTFTSRPWQGLF